jgi:hypothetical protein
MCPRTENIPDPDAGGLLDSTGYVRGHAQLPAPHEGVADVEHGQSRRGDCVLSRTAASGGDR